MEETLNVKSPVLFDDSVNVYEIHTHQPYATSTFNNSDEIHIAIQHQDHCLLPSKSSIHIQGKLTKTDNANVARTRFVNNAICHLFSEIRYELNAEVIDRCKNVGITTLMKGYPSYTPNQIVHLENAGWLSNDANQSILDNNGNFDVVIPLSTCLGFAEDYKKIVVNMKHELVLTRTNNDMNAIIGTGAQEDVKVTLTRIEWLMPYLVLSDQKKIELLKYVEKDPLISMGFRSWDLYEYPLLPETTNHVWTVKTSNQLEKPRFIILGFQTARNNLREANASRFDHCDIRNVKLFLNAQSFPYGNLNLDITHNKFAVLYNMFKDFQSSYYEKEAAETTISRTNFINNVPLIIIDCSKQSEFSKYAPVDVRLEFEANDDFPAATSAFCLILHDRIIQYKPISGEIKKL